MSAGDPRVSIIMPTYNRADLLPRSVRSVLRQTMPDFELIIIDDASTDETPEVVASFEDAHIRYICRTVNHLQLYKETGEEDNPRNDGLKQARGRYIAYLDSDDIYRTNFLEVMTLYMDEHPDVGLAYCDAIWHRHLPGEEEMANCNMSVDWGPRVMEHRNIIRTPTVMHRREVIKKVGFFKPVWVRVPHEGVPYVGIEDWDYWLRTSKKFKVKHYPVVLAHKINNTSDYYDDPDFDPEFLPSPASDPGAEPEILDAAYRVKVAAEFQAAVESLKDVEGYLTPLEGYALLGLAAHGYGLGRIVEIGGFLGRSTCFLALGSKKTNREKVATVDHFKGSKEHQPGKRFGCQVLAEEGTTYNRFLENLRLHKLKSRVQAIRSDSVAAAAKWDQPIRMLFIDGDHRYEGTRADFEAWSPFVIPGGYVAFHDVDSWEGVTQFYKELLKGSDEYTEVLAVDSLRVVRKAGRPKPWETVL